MRLTVSEVLASVDVDCGASDCVGPSVVVGSAVAAPSVAAGSAVVSVGLAASSVAAGSFVASAASVAAGLAASVGLAPSASPEPAAVARQLPVPTVYQHTVLFTAMQGSGRYGIHTSAETLGLAGDSSHYISYDDHSVVTSVAHAALDGVDEIGHCTGAGHVARAGHGGGHLVDTGTLGLVSMLVGRISPRNDFGAMATGEG